MTTSKNFQPSKFKEAAKEELRKGKTPEQVAREYPLSLRTLYRYLKEVQSEEQAQKDTGPGSVFHAQPIFTRPYLSSADEYLIIDAIMASPVSTRAFIKMVLEQGFFRRKGNL